MAHNTIHRCVCRWLHFGYTPALPRYARSRRGADDDQATDSVGWAAAVDGALTGGRQPTVLGDLLVEVVAHVQRLGEDVAA
jgi:hypothetical protein